MVQSIVPSVLRYVDQVARSGSIQAAAKELNIAASAIDRHILQIEDSLGVKLFDRVPRGMRLTVTGETLVAMARRWRDDERRALGDIRQLQGVPFGVVHLAAMDSHATTFLPALVERITSAHRLVSLSVEVLSTDDAVSHLLSGKADLAVVFNLPPRREFRVIWRGELPLGCVVAPGHPLARAGSTSLQEAAAYPVALQSKSLTIRRYLEAQHSWLFAEPRGRLETNSLHLVKRLVQSGSYIAFTSELDAANELVDGTLVFVPVRDKGAEPQSVSIVVNAAKVPGPAVNLVADQLVASVQACLAAVRAARGLA
ncbi:MAG: LysR family transcriptional regulator [Rhodoferax sp.]|nr:LysR family transcriptional regulator [Rhodoferax sp.]